MGGLLDRVIKVIPDLCNTCLDFTPSVHRYIPLFRLSDERLCHSLETKPFLMEHRSEMYGIIDTEYDEEKVMKAFKNEGYTEGREEGETIFIIKQVYSKIRKNKPVEQIADELEESDNISGISEIVGLIREVTPNLDMNEDNLAQNVLEKLSITS